MSSHNDLDEQFLRAVELDDARDDRRSITRGEFEKGAAAVMKWPKDRRDELLLMSPNERKLMLLLAGELGGMPESEEAPTVEA